MDSQKVNNLTNQDDVPPVGRITNFSSNLIQGWVHSEEKPGKRWVVSVIAGGKQVGLAIADQFHPLSPGDGCHGFRTMLNDDLIKGVDELSISLANDEENVLHRLSLSVLPQDTSHTTESSRVLWQPGLCLHGWLVDDQEPDQPLDILVYEGHRLIARAKPTRWQAIHGKYVEAGFSLDLPLSLADGKSHTLSVLDSKGRVLQGSPLTIQEWPKGLSSLLQTNLFETEKLAPLVLKVAQYSERVIQPSVRFDDYPLWLETFSSQTKMPSNKTKPTQKSLQAKKKPSSQQVKKIASTGPTLGVIWLGEPTSEAKALLSASDAFAVQHFSVTEVLSGDAYQETLQQAAEACDWIAQIQSQDHIAEEALNQIRHAMEAHRAKLYYTDFDYLADYPNDDAVINPHQSPRLPAFLPAFDIDRLWCQNYLNATLCIASSDLIQHSLVRLPNAPEQLSYALVMALAELKAELKAELSHADEVQVGETKAAKSINSQDVVHLPQIGLHRHDSGLNKAISASEFLARQEYLMQYDAMATLSQDEKTPQRLRLQRQLDTWPDVTLVIPTRDALSLLKKCIDTFFELTDYPGHVRLIILNNQSQKAETLEYFEHVTAQGKQKIGRGTAHVDVLDYLYPFNYASINNYGVQHSTSDVIGLVNNDIEILHPEWLCNMVALLMRQDTGIVGAKLLWPNNMVQHGGVIGGQFDGLAGHVGNQLTDEDLGYLNNNQLTQRFSMVTAACLLIRREDYWRVGGLNERDFPVGFNDVDLCLKVRALDKAVVWTPEATLIHAESATRGKDDVPEKAARAQREMHNLRQRWHHVLNNDPAYNPNLSLNLANAPFTALALPPRPVQARTNRLPGLISHDQTLTTLDHSQEDTL